MSVVPGKPILENTPSRSVLHTAGLDAGTRTPDANLAPSDDPDNNVICFVRGTRISTARGAVEVQDLQKGDLVITRDHGLQPVRWIGTRTIAAEGAVAPVCISRGTLNNVRDLYVSPKHCVLLQGAAAKRHFGGGEMFAAAEHLLNNDTVTQQIGGMVTYVHVLFDSHEIIYSEGAATESYFPTAQGLSAIEAAARCELLMLFPELATQRSLFDLTARRCLTAPEVALLNS
jgi:hypothetical protein